MTYEAFRAFLKPTLRGLEYKYGRGLFCSAEITSGVMQAFSKQVFIGSLPKPRAEACRMTICKDPCGCGPGVIPLCMPAWFQKPCIPSAARGYVTVDWFAANVVFCAAMRKAASIEMLRNWRNCRMAEGAMAEEEGKK